MIIQVSGPEKLNQVEITPVRSKSISNRLLIINMLTYPSFEIHNLSNAKDTLAMQDALKHIKKGQKEIFAGAGGTTYRFLTALLAAREGEWILNGDEQILNRPITDLVKALRSIDASIDHIEKGQYPPLRIKGKRLEGGKISINAAISSQFISALLLIAPTMVKGIQIKLEGEIVSKPYIDMTLGLLSQFGIKCSFHDDEIMVSPGKYINFSKVDVEPDWSAASYFYSIVTLADNESVFLNGFTKNSVQGDIKIAEIMKAYGIETEFFKEGIHIKKGREPEKQIKLDLKDNPDLVPTLAVLSAALGIKTIFRNIDHLAYKESDRLMALQQELLKLNTRFFKENNDWVLEPQKLPENIPAIETYDDHRIAMAFAPLACLMPVKITDPSVVNKSYPEFWDHLQLLGFSFS